MTYTGMVVEPLAWLSNPLQPTGTVIVCGTRRSGTPRTISQQGEVINYAGNRSEAAIYDGQTGTTPIVLVNLTDAGIAQLNAWLGTVLCLRTFEGARYFGAYFDVSQQVYVRPGVWDVSIEMTDVTYTDAV